MGCPGFEDYEFPKVHFKEEEVRRHGCITKPGSDENIKLGDSVPVVELDKIDSIGRWKDIHPPDTPGLIVPAYAPDEEIRAAAEVLKTLQNNNQQLATMEA